MCVSRRLDPKYAPAHCNLGNALQRKGRLDEAVAAYHKAIDLDPKDAAAHYNLGSALQAKGRLDEAIAEHRKAIDLDPKDARAHYNFGNALMARGRVDQAIAEYHKAIDIRPDYAGAHCNIGYSLLQRGDFAEALTALKCGHQLGSKRKDWGYPSAQWVQQCKQLLALDEKLPAILKGDAQPAENQERLQLADLCVKYKKRDVAAVGFFTDAFAADPKLADDLRLQHRYNAACSAALAGTGQGKSRENWGFGSCRPQPTGSFCNLGRLCTSDRGPETALLPHLARHTRERTQTPATGRAGLGWPSVLLP